MADDIVQAEVMDESIAPEERVVDDDLVLQRYNSQLPPSYRSALDNERKILIRALRFLVKSITSSTIIETDDNKSEESDKMEKNEYVSEGYQHEIERDFAALEKGISRYLDLKHAFEDDDYPLFFDAVLRGALTPNLDMGLRSKLARSASRLLSKRNCKLPNGAPWRRIVEQIEKFHIDCVDGVNYIGRNVRESHCRNLLSLLSKCRLFLAPDDSAEKIWNHFSSGVHSSNPDIQFQNLLLLTYVLPTHGDAWTGWLPDGMRLWKLFEFSTDWDAIWMTMSSRVARHQPCVHDFTPYLPWIYTRLEDACHLPIGAMSPQGSADRRCPTQIVFLMDLYVIPVAARLCIYSLSPKFPEALHFLKRFFALIANYFHPSNSGRWSSNIGSFMSNLTASFVARVVDERHATNAGLMDRVIGDTEIKGVAPAEHRLTDEYITEIIDMLLPLIDLGLHSKSHSMSVQAAASARDLSIIRPVSVIPPLLQKASDGLESISSPHRTTAALRLLSSLTPIFLDPEIFPDGPQHLPQALQLTLPGIDPNDPGKTESTLRFIGGASARIQGMINVDPMPIPEVFFDDYVQQFLERIFSLLDSLEAPPKKNPNGSYGGAQPLSFIIFAVAIENLFVALPAPVALSAARKVAKQLLGAACSNAIKYYGALVRTACAVASNAQEGSAVELFIPPLLDQLLEESNIKDDKCETKTTLVSVGDDELVWRIRMLAQSCRFCGSGIAPYVDKIMSVVKLAFEQPERAIYKSGGRLLRGLLEGLTAIQMKFDVGNGDDSDISESANGDVYNFHWRVPTNDDWKLAEDVLSKFVDHIDKNCTISESSSSDEIISQRDLIFRVLRMLHAAQRGGRWLLAGAMPKHFLVLDKYANDDVPLTKRDAKLILKRPVAAGLGGERSNGEYSTKTWSRIYSIVFNIMTTAIVKRPDDGALLYRCLEPLELAHEPFRRGSVSRNTIDAARSYKAAYKPVIAAKRPFGSEGGVGRAMPRFIVKLRIEAHHEMRLTAAARGGMDAISLSEKIIAKLTDLALNDFPRVRGEARGVLTRALRVTRPEIRRNEIVRIIEVLRSSASKTKSRTNTEQEEKKNDDASGNGDSHDKVMKDVDVDTKTVLSPSKKKGEDDVMYEKMIGSCSVLCSSAAAPLIMRDTRLFSQIMRAFLEAMPKAERPEAAGAVGDLFGKLSSLVRPLGIDPIRLIEPDLVSLPNVQLNVAEANGRALRLQAYNELNEYLLSVIKSGGSEHGIVDDKIRSKDNDQKAPNTKNGMDVIDILKHAKKAEAHWRVQSLVAVLLLVLIREDMPPIPEVAEFFMRGVVSDVVAVRHICSRGVSLILALHGRKAGVSFAEAKKALNNVDFDDSPTAWQSAKCEAIAAMGRIVCDKAFAEKVVHTLALDHDEDGEGSSRRGGDLFAMLSYSRVTDGETCWSAFGGRPWPTSWTPRSRDSLNLVRIRFYEGLIRVYGRSMVEALLPCAKDLVTKLEAKQERIISGVTDEDVRVLTAELISAICRGLDVHHCGGENAKMEEDSLFKETTDLTKTLLHDMTGPMGNTNGASLIRLAATADKFTIGPRVMRDILDWQLESKPLIVALGNGPHAHLQARRLRYIHSCIADIDEAADERMVKVMHNAVGELVGNVGFNHELKTVREEVGRLLSLLAVSVCPKNSELFGKAIENMCQRLLTLEQNGVETTEKEKDSDAADIATDVKMSDVKNGEEKQDDSSRDKDKKDEARKSRSREGETLSRFVSIVYWNGRARSFEPFVPGIIPALFRSFDESDQERISHAKMALSLTAQGCFKEKTLDALLTAAETTVKDGRWKVRGSVLGFLQILSFCSLFLASEKILGRVRRIVFGLLSDAQIEVRQSAAAAFVTMIRDAEGGVVEELRDTCLKALRETSWRRRRNTSVITRSTNNNSNNTVKRKKPVLEGDKLFRRHGAVLGLSSMVTSSPYSVPEWMPTVLVALADCVNDPPPICTGVRELFGDFMRTHRDEWQTHKLAFSPDELEIVSELLVSPSYYA